MESLTQYDGFCEWKRCLILIHRAKDYFKGKTHHLYTHTHTNTVKLIPRGIAIRQKWNAKALSLCWRCEKSISARNPIQPCAKNLQTTTPDTIDKCSFVDNAEYAKYFNQCITQREPSLRYEISQKSTDLMCMKMCESFSCVAVRYSNVLT